MYICTLSGTVSGSSARDLHHRWGMHQYYYNSLHDRDKVFGANTDAYSTKWQGVSQAYPPWTPNDMDKAMKWAILSAVQSAEATLTLLILPEVKGSSYCKWALHPPVTLLTQIQKQHIRSNSHIIGRQVSQEGKCLKQR